MRTENFPQCFGSCGSGRFIFLNINAKFQNLLFLILPKGSVVGYPSKLVHPFPTLNVAIENGATIDIQDSELEP